VNQFIGDKLRALAGQDAAGSVRKRQNRYTNSPSLAEKLTEPEDRYIAARTIVDKHRVVLTIGFVVLLEFAV
jgi:hypothetical protein